MALGSVNIIQSYSLQMMFGADFELEGTCTALNLKESWNSEYSEIWICSLGAGLRKGDLEASHRNSITILILEPIQ